MPFAQLANPLRRPGILRDLPLVLLISPLALPIGLPAAIAISIGAGDLHDPGGGDPNVKKGKDETICEMTARTKDGLEATASSCCSGLERSQSKSTGPG